jgi:DNA-binding MarR family transcriptional regulator
VTLTDQGARLLKRCEKAARQADDELLAPLSTAERDQSMSLLIRISGTEG